MNHNNNLSDNNYLDILVCPYCKSSLKDSSDNIICCNNNCNNIYPIINGVPILINEKNSIFSIKVFRDKKDTFFRLNENPLKLFIKDLIPGITLNLKSKINFKKLKVLLYKQSSNPLILVLGGSIEGEGIKFLKKEKHIELIETDISFGPMTRFICDAHDIPFADRTFDCVIVQAVLEHVVDPYRCVEEIYRVLKDNAIVYSEIPFMQQVHGREYDFNRFTLLGQMRLFRRFEEIESGTLIGTATALAWSYKYFLISISNYVIIRRILGIFAHITTFWIKYFDYLLINKIGTIDGASGYYFIGRKGDSILTDRELIKRYRGGF